MKRFILVAAMAIATVAICQAKGPVKGNGVEKNDARTIGAYTAISVNDGIALNFSREHLSGVVVTADENICEYVVTEVMGGELIIRLKSGENIKPKKDIVVTVPNNGMITLLTVNGDSKFTVKEEVVADNMKIKAMGGAQIKMGLDISQVIEIELVGDSKCDLDGKAIEMKLVLEGGSKFNGYSFKTRIANCELAGNSDAKIQCNDRIESAELTGNSSLYFKGECEINKISLKGGSTIGNR